MRNLPRDTRTAPTPWQPNRVTLIATNTGVSRFNARWVALLSREIPNETLLGAGPEAGGAYEPDTWAICNLIGLHKKIPHPFSECNWQGQFIQASSLGG